MDQELKDLQKRKFSTKMVAAGIVLIAVVISFFSVFYVWNLQELFDEESGIYLNELSHQVADMVQFRTEMNLQHLETISEALVSGSELTSQQVQEYLDGEAARYGYQGVVAYSLAGEPSCHSDGHGYLASQEFLHHTLEGKDAISSIVSSHSGGEQYILFGVPIRKGEQVAGAVVASRSLETMQDMLNVESFNGEGFSQIIRRTGEYVVASPNKNAPTPTDNYFTMLQEQARAKYGHSIDGMVQDVQNGGSGILEVNLDGVDRHISYLPLGIKDWYLLTEVPSDIITARPNLFIQRTSVLCGLVILLFVLLSGVLAFQQESSRRKLSKIAFVDPVTEGYSKSRFQMEMMKRLAKAAPKQYALISMDIEKFKLVNEAFGREAGNKLLKYILHEICGQLQPGDVAARSTSDNFLILIHNPGTEALTQWIEKLSQRINRFNENLTKKYYMSFSYGVFVIDDVNLDFDTIQDRANVARDGVKRNAERFGQCMFYSDVTRLRMIQEKEIENRMEQALKDGEFVVYLQPKVELESNTIAGAEALVRWKDPEKGIIPPLDFIPLFERNGFIVELDLYVFDQVCKKIRNWIDKGLRPVTVSVNLSRVHLNNPDFLSRFEELFQKYDIPANLIEIELTETVVFENMELLIHVIDQIHKMGFTCSLDDFGSGYSSLNILKDVPVDVIKLDKAFFHSVGSNAENKRGDSVVESVIELAKKLEIHTVSEGVETIPQVDFLRRVHCDMIQGYVFSKPVPMEEFDAMAYGKQDASVMEAKAMVLV